MSDIKKAFEKLDSHKLSDDKKQQIFDSIVDTHRQRRSFRKKLFTIGAPVFAACVIAAAAFILPGVIAPGKQPADMVKIDSPQDDSADSDMLMAQGPQVVSTVVMSLNPVVEFGLDENSNVVEVQGMDEDGERLVEGIDFAGLSFENAAIVVVNQLLLNDYISSGVSQAQITVSLESEQAGMDTLNVLTDTITTAAVQHKIDVNVTPSQETKELSIVLTGDGDSTQAATDEGPVKVQYIQGKVGTVESVHAHRQDGSEMIDSVDFADMPFKEAVLYSVNDLIRQGVINDEGESEILFNIGTTDEMMSAGFKYLTQLLLTQAGLSLEVLGTDEAGVFGLALSKNTSDEKAQLTMSKILDPTMHKNISELTKTQKDILEFVYTTEQIEELFAIRYWVVVPNLVGMQEAKAVELLEKMGIVPVVTRQYNEDYAQFEEGTVFLQDMTAGAMVEKGARFKVSVLGSNPSPLGEGWTLSVHSDLDIADDTVMSTQYEKYDSSTSDIYIRITNQNENEMLLYDTDYTLEKMYDGEWYSAACTKCFEPAARQLEPLGTTGEKIGLEFAGGLEDGHYRIVKQLGQNKYSAQFDIEEGGYNERMLSGYLPLDELPSEYTAETALHNGDITADGAGGITNEEKLDMFLKTAGENIPCKLRITHFTQDGYANIEDVVFNGKHYYVQTDDTRAAEQPKEAYVSRYSYIMLYTEGEKTGIMLANNYIKMPVGGEYANTQGYVLLDDIQLLKDADAAKEKVIALMDEKAPLKVYSPDGFKFVSYLQGKKTVNYEVAAQSQYASGIILPEDCAEVVALEWRDNSVVVITYRTQEGSYLRIAFDVDIQGFTQVSEQENTGIGTVEQDYFTQQDMQELTQEFINNISGFSLLLEDETETVYYRINANEAVITITQPGSEPEVQTAVWDEQTWNGFIERIVGLGVLDWNMVYDGPDSETAWTLELSCTTQSFISIGRGGQQFDELSAITGEYFSQYSG